MKNLTSLLMILCMAIITIFTINACQKENDQVVGANSDSDLNWRATQNSILYPPTSHPFGKSYEEYIHDWWMYTVSLDCETLNPTEVTTENFGENLVILSGRGPAYTIPKDKALFFPFTWVINDWPCPDTSFHPAPGQSMEDFLQEGAAAINDGYTNLELVLDGTEVNLEDYRFQSDLFWFTGNTALNACFDPCITGEPQQGVTDGYCLIFKKLSPGEHTLQFSITFPDGNSLEDIMLTLTVPE